MTETSDLKHQANSLIDRLSILYNLTTAVDRLYDEVEDFANNLSTELSQEEYDQASQKLKNYEAQVLEAEEAEKIALAS